MGLPWLLYLYLHAYRINMLLGPIVDFGGEVFVQSTPGFVLGIRENHPDRFC
jgi:hypothetical protein